jgi:hypothetical protein
MLIPDFPEIASRLEEAVRSPCQESCLFVAKLLGKLGKLI